MKDYVILTDSCCDLSAGMAEELELHVLPLSFVMEEKIGRASCRERVS